MFLSNDNYLLDQPTKCLLYCCQVIPFHFISIHHRITAWNQYITIHLSNNISRIIRPNGCLLSLSSRTHQVHCSSLSALWCTPILSVLMDLRKTIYILMKRRYNIVKNSYINIFRTIGPIFQLIMLLMIFICYWRPFLQTKSFIYLPPSMSWNHSIIYIVITLFGHVSFNKWFQHSMNNYLSAFVPFLSVHLIDKNHYLWQTTILL